SRRAESPAAWRRPPASTGPENAFARCRTVSMARLTRRRRLPPPLGCRKGQATTTGEGPMRTSDWHAVDAERQTAGTCGRAGKDFPVPDRDIVRRLFGARVIDDGAGMIQLDVAPVATRGDHVPLSVEVNWWLVLAKAVARLYLIAEGNRD